MARRDAQIREVGPPEVDITAPPSPPAAKPALPARAGTALTAIGWGAILDEQGKEVFPNTLQQVRLQLQPLGVCEAYWPGGGPVGAPWRSNAALCAGNPPANNKDACAGDSGGPLFLPADRGGRGRDVVLGVVRCVRGRCWAPGLQWTGAPRGTRAFCCSAASRAHAPS